MNPKQDELFNFYQSYTELIDSLETNTLFPEFFYGHFAKGNNTIYQKNIAETKIFDEEWIRTIESYFPSLNKIAMDPKNTLRYEEDVVAIEKARKINSQSIRHLSSHTQFIKEVQEDATVVPKKILTTYSEIEYGTYENRLIMTLIERLFVFVRSRYEIIKENVESFQKKHLNLTSSFPILDKEVTLTVDVVLKEDLDNKNINEYNQKLLQRVEHLDKLCNALRASQFMQLMNGQKKIIPPIMKTQIIQKNVDYRNAYTLWLFLDRYNRLAFDIDVKEKTLELDQAYLDDIYQMALITFSTVMQNQENRKETYDQLNPKSYRRKGLKQTVKNVDDIILNPKAQPVEDQGLNEYYLEQNKRLFRKSLQYHDQHSATYETTLKRALRDTTHFTNKLYESFFELGEEEDYFRRLVKEEDPIKELKSAKEKALIAKMIREVKEVDYNESLRQERRLIKRIEALDKKLIAASKQDKLISTRKMRSVESLKLEKDKAKLQDKALKNKQELVKQHREKQAEIKSKAQQKIQELMKVLKEEQQFALKEIQKEHRQKLKVEADKLKNNQDGIKKALKIKQVKLKKETDLSYKKTILTLNKDYERLLKQERLKQEKLEKKLLQEEEKMKAQALRQEVKNQERLEKMKKSQEAVLIAKEEKLKEVHEQEVLKTKELEEKLNAIHAKKMSTEGKEIESKPVKEKRLKTPKQVEKEPKSSNQQSKETSLNQEAVIKKPKTKKKGPSHMPKSKHTNVGFRKKS